MNENEKSQENPTQEVKKSAGNPLQEDRPPQKPMQEQPEAPQEPQQQELSEEQLMQLQIQQFYAFQRELLKETLFILHKLKPNIEQEMMRTGELSRRIGEAFGIQDDEYYLAGFYANIGLLGIESFISNERQYTVQDAKLYERHPTISYEVLEQKGLKRAAIFVLNHHEKPNGTGYQRKTSAKYPKESAYIHIADKFQGYISAQTHRPKFSYQEALDKVMGSYRDYLMLNKQEVQTIEAILKDYYENSQG